MSHGARADDVTLCNKTRQCALRSCGCQWKWSVVYASCSATQSLMLSLAYASCFVTQSYSIHYSEFSLLVPILISLSSCINSSSLFPVAILWTLLHRENTSFEVWYLQTTWTIEFTCHRFSRETLAQTQRDANVQTYTKKLQCTFRSESLA